MPNLFLEVKVIPKAKNNKFGPWQGSFLKIYLQAAPEKNQANRALIQFLAQALKLRQIDIIIISGQTSPRKRLLLENITAAELQSRLPPQQS